MMLLVHVDSFGYDLMECNNTVFHCFAHNSAAPPDGIIPWLSRGT